MWCSAAVGTLAGLGFVIQGAIGTGVVLFVHLALRPLVRKIEAKTKGTGDVETFYRVRVVCPNDQLAVVRNIFMRHVNSQPTMTVQGISTQDTDQPERSAVLVEIFATERNDKYMNDLVSRICIEPSVSSVSWEKTR
jgi:putative Mg2+ transporter-C (MgtC) family protein